MGPRWTLRIAVAAVFAVSLGSAPAGAGDRRSLIEFGWDEPDSRFLREHLAEMEKTPFDGCVYHVDAHPARAAPASLTWQGWGRRRFSADELAEARADLEAVASSPSRFRRNFLRFNTTPADLDWFDDYAAVVANARFAAELARASGGPGILLDTEAYEGKLFDYRKQREAPRRPWAEYAAQARRRGREVMSAMQDGYPDLTVFLTFGYTLPWKQSERGRKPLAECSEGLLVPFLDGMVSAARGRARIVDGHELSYGYRDRSAFVDARCAITKDAAALADDPAAYARVISAGFGLWLDHDWRKVGWHPDDPSKNHFTPAGFGASLRSALELSDEYVWIYTETPRWWSARGGPVALPPAYVEAIRRARSAD